jgi:subtilisin family serine protease
VSGVARAALSGDYAHPSERRRRSAQVAACGSHIIVTTAATNSTNQEASFSNYGKCVDLWAPGVGILST